MSVTSEENNNGNIIGLLIETFRGRFISFLSSDFFPVFISIIVFASMLLDHDVSYTNMIQNPIYFRMHEGNEIFKNYAGTNLWYIISLREIFLFSLVVTLTYKIKNLYFRLVILLLSIYVNVAFISWVIKKPLYFELIPLIALVSIPLTLVIYEQ